MVIINGREYRNQKDILYEIQDIAAWKNRPILQQIWNCLEIEIQIVDKNGYILYYNDMCGKIDRVSPDAP